MIRVHHTSVSQTIDYPHWASRHEAGYSLVKLASIISLVCVGCAAAPSFFSCSISNHSHDKQMSLQICGDPARLPFPLPAGFILCCGSA